MKVISFGKGARVYTFPPTVREITDNFASLQDNVLPIVGAHGGLAQYGASAPPAVAGQVRVRVLIRTDDRCLKMDQAIDELRAITAWGKVPLVIKADGALRRCDAIAVDVSAPRDLANHGELWADVTITFSVPFPFWYSEGNEAVLWGDGALWSDGTIWGGSASWNTVTGASTTFDITVAKGNVPTYPRINFQCQAGETATNIIIQRLINAQVVDEVSYADTVPANGQLGINTRALSVEMNGADAYNVFDFLQSHWFALETGVNNIRVLMDGGSAGRVRFSYYEMWR